MGAMNGRLLPRKKTPHDSNTKLKTALSNVPGLQPPPSFDSSNKKNQTKSKSNAKYLDINKLPRQTKVTDELDAELTEKNNQKNRKSLYASSNYNNGINDNKYNTFSEISFVESEIVDNKYNYQLDDTEQISEIDPDIEYLVKEVARRAKLNDDLDERIKNNQRKLDSIYEKDNENIYQDLDSDSRFSNRNESNKGNNNLSIEKFFEDNIEGNKMSNDDMERDLDRMNKLNIERENLKRELLALNELENRQRLKLLEQNRELAVHTMKMEGEMLAPANNAAFYDFERTRINERKTEQKLINLEKIKQTDEIIPNNSNSSITKYLSLITKYEKDPLTNQIQPTEQLIKYPASCDLYELPLSEYYQSISEEVPIPEAAKTNDLQIEDEDTKFLGYVADLNDVYAFLNEEEQELVDEQNLYKPKQTLSLSSQQEKFQQTDGELGPVYISSTELQNIALIIKEQEEKANKNGVKRRSSYFLNGQQIYPDGILESLIKDKKLVLQDSQDFTAKNSIEKKKNLNVDENPKGKSISHLFNKFNESDSSLYAKVNEAKARNLIRLESSSNPNFLKPSDQIIEPNTDETKIVQFEERFVNKPVQSNVKKISEPSNREEKSNRTESTRLNYEQIKNVRRIVDNSRNEYENRQQPPSQSQSQSRQPVKQQESIPTLNKPLPKERNKKQENKQNLKPSNTFNSVRQVNQTYIDDDQYRFIFKENLVKIKW